jgi:glycosyltransferase involved in cell wall biosynthesis
MPADPQATVNGMRICFAIPHYRHETLLPELLNRIGEFGLHAIIVDDGSPPGSFAVLQALADEHNWLTLDRLEKNSGKGAAVIRALQLAKQLNYTHAIQIDADGQHDTGDVPDFIAEAQKYPQALVSGAPVFGDDIPKARLWGRELTNFWIHVETLSRRIPDGMCGFRLYPVDAAVMLAEHSYIGRRMDFDVEFLVRAVWQGWNVIFLPTQVRYGQDGVSHFHMFRDNCWITLMHTRLVIGMLVRLPVLLRRKFLAVIRATPADNSQIDAIQTKKPRLTSET